MITNLIIIGSIPISDLIFFLYIIYFVSILVLIFINYKLNLRIWSWFRVNASDMLYTCKLYDFFMKKKIVANG